LVAISIQSVSKEFNGKKVLKDITCNIEDSSFTTLLGPVGAGKTTLLKIIAGIERPDKGSILFNDKEVTHLPPRERNVALVFQSFALYPHMRVFDNIASPLRVAKKNRSEIERRVIETAKLLKIDHLLSRLPAELSGGEKQRVAIARALIKDANVYLFDEPLTNLDYKIRESMRSELRKIFREKGGTILFAASDPLDAFSMSKYVIIIDNGRILQSGRVEEVYNRPKNTAVARILARPPMNFIDTVLEKKDGKLLLRLDEYINIDISHLGHLINEEDEYIIGIRPEKIHLLKYASIQAGKENIILSSSVIVTEIEGSESIIHFEWKGKRMSLYYPYIIRMEPGEKFDAVINLDDVYIFSKSTGVLIAKYNDLRWK